MEKETPSRAESLEHTHFVQSVVKAETHAPDDLRARIHVLEEERRNLIGRNEELFDKVASLEKGQEVFFRAILEVLHADDDDDILTCARKLWKSAIKATEELEKIALLVNKHWRDHDCVYDEVEFFHAKYQTLLKRNRVLTQQMDLALEGLRLIDMRKEGFEEDLVCCQKIAFETLEAIQLVVS